MGRNEWREQQQGLQDHDGMGGRRHSSAEKRRAKIMATIEEPIWPRLTRILLLCMPISCAAMALVEIRQWYPYAQIQGIGQLLCNLSISCLGMWLLWALLLTAACLLGMRRVTSDFRKRRAVSGLMDETAEDKARTQRALRRLSSEYRSRILIAAIGLVVWLLLYLLCRLLF